MTQLLPPGNISKGDQHVEELPALPCFQQLDSQQLRYGIILDDWIQEI